jgi:hypothetical protein
MDRLRVFLSSPGDVSNERAIARETLERLQRDPAFRDKITIDVVAWDDPEALVPLLLTQNPQDTVNLFKKRPSECDFTVLILWSRIGTPLPCPPFAKSDGAAYASGTEWEFEDARAAGKPVFFYQRSEEPRIGLKDPQAAEKKRQYEAVENFVAQFRLLDGSSRGGKNAYDDVAAFKRIFEAHMRSEIARRLDDDARTRRPGRDAFRIFFAVAAEELRFTRMKLVEELGRDPSTIEVLREVPPPLDRTSHTLAAEEHAKTADLSVHLLGAQPGAEGVGWTPPGSTYVLEQARIGLKSARAQLIVHPAALDLPLVSEGPYKEFLTSLPKRPEGGSRLELVRASSDAQMLQAILAKIRQLRSIASGDDPQVASDAFIDLHIRDFTQSQWLVSYLSEAKGFRLLMSPAGVGTSPREAATWFANNLKRARNVFVVFGGVAREWVEQRLADALNLKAELGLATKIGVYVTGPNGPGPNGAAPPATAFGCPVVYDETTVEAFLNGGE